jgi:predicted dehydrogenase
MNRRTFLAAPLAFAVRLPRKVRVAMIGLEGHSAIVLDALKDLPQVELAAFYDPDPKRGAKLAAKRYTDWRDLLDKERLDVIGIAGSNADRAPVILAAAARKIHIAAEKPLALTRAELAQIQQAVTANGIRLTMFLPMRFYGSYTEMRRIVASGAIGEVAEVDAQKSYQLGPRPDWMTHHATYGGTIPYIGIHMVDLIRYTTGRDITEAFSMQNRIGHPEMGDMENTTGTVFRLNNGGVSVLHMDYLRPTAASGHGDDRLRVAGTKGVVEFREHTGVTLVTDSEKERLIDPLPPDRSLFADFLDSVYNGKAPGLTLDDVYRANEIVLAARESAETGKVVKA